MEFDFRLEIRPLHCHNISNTWERERKKFALDEMKMTKMPCYTAAPFTWGPASARPCARVPLALAYGRLWAWTIKYNNENDYFIRCNFIYNTQFNIKLTDMHWLNWIYSLADNFDLSLGLVNVFDIFVTESETVFYCYIWKMDLALLHCYSRDREFFANLAFFAAHGPRFFRFLAAKKLHH